MTTAGGVEAADVFLRAIDLEIEAVLTGSATDVTPLHHGTRTGTDGNDFEYVFQTRSKPNLARRSLIRSSTSRGRWERATAAVLPNGKVRVTTSADFGRESVRAQLREDATAPLEQLAERAAEELAQRSTQLSARLDAVRANIVLHDRLAAAERRLEALSAGRDALERRAADADAAMSRSSEQAQAVQQERVRIGSPGLLFAQRKQRRIDDLEADIVALRRAAERARVDPGSRAGRAPLGSP
jgi:hypothetical protein